MLFVDEAPLSHPIKGVSTFTTTFPHRGPRDKQGRSLRDFDLNKRLFRYPLSYMIYSQMFETMPAVARDRVYQRLFEVLSGRDTNPKFCASLSNRSPGHTGNSPRNQTRVALGVTWITKDSPYSSKYYVECGSVTAPVHVGDWDG